VSEVPPPFCRVGNQVKEPTAHRVAQERFKPRESGFRAQVLPHAGNMPPKCNDTMYGRLWKVMDGLAYESVCKFHTKGTQV
jgi:hypothetical protein